MGAVDPPDDRKEQIVKRNEIRIRLRDGREILHIQEIIEVWITPEDPRYEERDAHGPRERLVSGSFFYVDGVAVSGAEVSRLIEEERSS